MTRQQNKRPMMTWLHMGIQLGTHLLLLAQARQNGKLGRGPLEKVWVPPHLTSMANGRTHRSITLFRNELDDSTPWKQIITQVMEASPLRGLKVDYNPVVLGILCDRRR